MATLKKANEKISFLLSITMINALVFFGLSACSNSAEFIGKSISGKKSDPAPIAKGDADSNVRPAVDLPAPSELPQVPVGDSGVVEFDLGLYTSELDMVWVIDNSKSMVEEIDQVEANFIEFAESLGQNINLKIALISAIGTSTSIKGITIPDELPPLIEKLQIDKYVYSNNSLEIAAYTSCPAESSSSKSVCGTSITRNENGAGLTSFGPTYSEKGALSDFFRPGAKRIYIFVTDDNAASYFYTDEFLSALTPHLNGSDLSVYGFVGKGTKGCHEAMVGLAYTKLAEKTGGRTYDICESDWSQNFKDLTSDIKVSIKSEFAFEVIPNKILSVTLVHAGTNKRFELNKNEYNIDKNILKLSPRQEAVSYEGKLIVEYE
ncbi:MAG: hypothetical protein KBD78_11485 [Oligoflexales bacterium]|nr:hypothetical protein [Oligoflexales bacterium]